MKSMPLHVKIFAGMLLGVIAGVACRNVLGDGSPDLKWWVDEVAKPVGSLFLRLIFMVVIPLLFSAVVLGIGEMGDLKKVGKIGVRALLMTVLLSGIAVGLALFSVNLTQPGAGFSSEKRAELMASFGKKEDADKSIEKSKEAVGPVQTIVNFFPENPLEEAAKPKLGGMLPFMVFAVIFGIAMTSVDFEKTSGLRGFLEGLFAVSLRMIEMAMKFAPIGVFALLFAASATLGVDAFMALGKYAGLVLAVLAIHLFVTYSVVLKVIAKRNPIEFFKSVRAVILTAFSTSSSNATLPTALRVGEEELGIPRPINNFVLTVGATANQNGTALFEGITVLFLAQMFGVALSLPQQLAVVGMAIMAGVGTAGVPGGAWPMIAAICSMVGVPPEAIALCIGIDRILDMSRTVVNVIGDMTIAACVARGEIDIPEAALG